MTGRPFDPVFSAALRNQLESLADEARQSGTRRPAVSRIHFGRQLVVAAITALVVVAATIGVLHTIGAHGQAPAQPQPRLIDPLTHLTDPSDTMYVSRFPRVLLDVHGEGTGTRIFQVPAGVHGVSTYFNCTPGHRFRTEIDHDAGGFASDCSSDSGVSAGVNLPAGDHTVTTHLAAGAHYALVIIAAPAPTISTGPLLDPLTAVRDLRNPDALTGDTTPLLQLHGSGVTEQHSFSTEAGRRLRVYLACQPTDAATFAFVDGHPVTGCMNAIAHWFDFTPKSSIVPVQVHATDGHAWALLVVPAPTGTQDSPANTPLAFPAVAGVVGRARGSGAPVTARTSAPVKSLLVTVTCHGTGWVQIQNGDGSTNGRGAQCGPGLPTTSKYGDLGDGHGGLEKLGRLTYTVTPHGDITWTVTLSEDH